MPMSEGSSKSLTSITFNPSLHAPIKAVFPSTESVTLSTRGVSKVDIKTGDAGLLILMIRNPS